jgi:predicted nucleotidyltransferase
MIIPNMGMKASSMEQRRATSLSDALFTRTQQRVLGLLYGRPTRSYYGNELIGLAGTGSGAVQRELARLTQSGILIERAIGNQKHYQANPDSPIFAELCAITQRTFGLADPLREALAPLASRIRAAFVYGSVAKQQDTASSDIDLMIVSDDLSYGEVFGALEASGARLGRIINPTVMTKKDLAQRVRQRKSFVSRVLAQPKIWLIGAEDDLRV